MYYTSKLLGGGGGRRVFHLCPGMASYCKKQMKKSVSHDKMASKKRRVTEAIVGNIMF